VLFKLQITWSITFESGSRLSRIKANAFCGTGLIEIIIPASIEFLGEESLSKCNSLSSITFESGVVYRDVNVHNQLNFIPMDRHSPPENRGFLCATPLLTSQDRIGRKGRKGGQHWAKCDIMLGQMQKRRTVAKPVRNPSLTAQKKAMHYGNQLRWAGRYRMKHQNGLRASEELLITFWQNGRRKGNIGRSWRSGIFRKISKKLLMTVLGRRIEPEVTTGDNDPLQVTSNRQTNVPNVTLGFSSLTTPPKPDFVG
jgi:hypothetical protein